jgi:tetratricopeptide (TPR) repeat protein
MVFTGRMAKRKKKSGGGFSGNEAKVNPSDPDPQIELAASRREPERSLGLIQKALASKNFASTEEMERYLNENFTGKTMDEFGALLAEDAPQDDLSRAQRLLDDLADEPTPAEIRRAAKAALKISEDCCEAWHALSDLEKNPAKALKLVDQGIARGRIRCADLLDHSDDNLGLWGWIEARDFLRLLRQRAVVLEELGNFEQAVITYQEILGFNPTDNLGVRGDLLRLLMVFRRLEDGRILLDRFPNDTLPEMAYGRAFLSFVETMDRTGFAIPDMEAVGAPRTPPAVMKCLGAEFDAAKKFLKQAVKLNPFVPWMMTHPQLLGVEIPDEVIFGGPYEAVLYAQKWVAIWCAPVLPFFAMTAAMESDPMRHAKSKGLVVELLDVLDQLESLDDVPWWEKFKL